VYTQAIQKLKFSVILDRVQRYAHSSMGKERIARCTPSSSLREIVHAHDLLNEMKTILESDEPVPLSDIHDIRTDIHRAAIEGNILTGKQLLHIGLTLKTSRELRNYFKKRSEKYPQLSLLSENLIIDKMLEHHIDGIVNEDGDIRDDASQELQKIRSAIRSVSETLRKRLERILKSLSTEGMAQEELITTRDGRMVLPVKVEYKHKVPGFIHSASASGATVFIEPAETLEINNEMRDYQIREQREIQRILRAITENIAERKTQLLVSLDTLAEFDFVYAKAQYSIEIIGVTSHANPQNVIRISDARHPILLHHHKRDYVVPLSLTIGDSYNTLIITGPNAGGKSVAMQTVGLLCLMYQSGLHIPASDQTELPVFEKIFVSMGDEQSIEQDLSTFSSHLNTLKKIAEKANEKSLVLIDEIGAGTDPVEGSAIAASILQHLTDKAVISIATTHHGDLKAFAYTHPGIENGAMEFDQDNLTPTYRFTAGIPGSSYALEIAQRLEVPADILSRARNYLGTTKSKIEQLLIELEQKSQRYERQLTELSAEKIYLEKLTVEYEEKLNTLKREIKTLKRDAAEDAQRLVARANAIIEQAVKDIRESQADSSITRRWRDEIKSFKEEVEKQRIELKEEQQERSDSTPIEKGDYVVLGESLEEGEVLTAVDDEGFIQVLFGSVKMRVHFDRLRKQTRRDKPKQLYSAPVAVLDDQIYPRSVDVRGMTGDEAVNAVEVFLDRVLLAGYNEVEIIHGKGTGTLRKRINEYLKEHPHVHLTRLGNWNEGGTGVTVVEIKQKQT
jgi:DNA mismatch repair protein MutS2